MRSHPLSRASHAIRPPTPTPRRFSVDVFARSRLGRIVRQSGWCCLLAVLALPASAQPPGPGAWNPADGSPRVPGFGPLQGQRAVPGFGTDTLPQVPITPEDLARADERMQRYDTNRDGYIDRNEASSGQWRDEPFQFDTDRDGRLEPNGTGTPLRAAASWRGGWNAGRRSIRALRPRRDRIRPPRSSNGASANGGPWKRRPGRAEARVARAKAGIWPRR